MIILISTSSTSNFSLLPQLLSYRKTIMDQEDLAPFCLHVNHIIYLKIQPFILLNLAMSSSQEFESCRSRQFYYSYTRYSYKRSRICFYSVSECCDDNNLRLNVAFISSQYLDGSISGAEIQDFAVIITDNVGATGTAAILYLPHNDLECKSKQAHAWKLYG
jgi:hypothetical protein